MRHAEIFKAISEDLDHLFKAELPKLPNHPKSVLHPGVRGGKYYRTKTGEVRYGQPPDADHPTLDRVGPEHMGTGHTIQVERQGEKLSGVVSKWGKHGATLHVTSPTGDYFTRVRYEDIRGISPSMEPHAVEEKGGPTSVHKDKWAKFPEGAYDASRQDEYDAYRERSKEWDQKIREDISEGKISPEDAMDLGYSTRGDETDAHSFSKKGHRWTDLPKTLYHVTTDRKGVTSKGLMSRAQLGQEHGKGLGGGDDSTISFTDDPKVAQNIHHTLLEAREVASGEMGVDRMLADADAGKYDTQKAPDARRRFMHRFMAHYNRDWKEGDPIPNEVEAARRGVKIDHTMGGGHTELSKELTKTGDQRAKRLHDYVDKLAKKYKVELKTSSDHSKLNKLASKDEQDTWLAYALTGGSLSSRFFKEDLPTGWTPTERDSQATPKGPLYAFAERPSEEDEAAQQRFDVYKTFLMARENAPDGGQENPLFFLSDVKGLAKLKPEDISIITAEPRPKAKGYKLGALGEWRTHSGKAVQVVGAYP